MDLEHVAVQLVHVLPLPVDGCGPALQIALGPSARHLLGVEQQLKMIQRTLRGRFLLASDQVFVGEGQAPQGGRQAREDQQVDDGVPQGRPSGDFDRANKEQRRQVHQANSPAPRLDRTKRVASTAARIPAQPISTPPAQRASIWAVHDWLLRSANLSSLTDGHLRQCCQEVDQGKAHHAIVEATRQPRIVASCGHIGEIPFGTA